MQGCRVFYFDAWCSRDAAGRRIQGSLKVIFDAAECKVAGIYFGGADRQGCRSSSVPWTALSVPRNKIAATLRGAL
jgi:hypothetical protein